MADILTERSERRGGGLPIERLLQLDIVAVRQACARLRGSSTLCRCEWPSDAPWLSSPCHDAVAEVVAASGVRLEVVA